MNAIITIVLKFIFKLMGMEYERSKQSEVDALKGRAQSVEDSYAEQDKANKEAESARKEVEKQGNDEDVFGADEWNGEKDEKPE